jgi:phosphotransferase system HPr (HPr) family protein
VNASRDVLVRNRSGLHARPAARFIEKAQSFDSAVSIEKDGRSANAKSLIGVLKLGISAGAQIRVSAEGPDAEDAVLGLVGFLEELLAEEGEG